MRQASLKTHTRPKRTTPPRPVKCCVAGASCGDGVPRESFRSQLQLPLLTVRWRDGTHGFRLTGKPLPRHSARCDVERGFESIDVPDTRLGRIWSWRRLGVRVDKRGELQAGRGDCCRLNDGLRARWHDPPFPVERMLAGNSFVSHTFTLHFKVP